MKKVLLIALVAALVIPVFADDALVMPAQVFRTYITGAYATVNNAYDNDGKTVDISSNAVTVFNMGAALEVGINDWITGAVQWAPGYNVYSKIDGKDKANLADSADLFVGAKLQIVGPKVPVQNETFRFAVA
ncbi:MAG TPA: hypothetical protein VMC79_03300, partial [Rectinemataceae bacterium]|nr:hypothetical protein [Rectinemataceae bacterium]